jgi:hypothetical protein
MDARGEIMFIECEVAVMDARVRGFDVGCEVRLC